MNIISYINIIYYLDIIIVSNSSFTLAKMEVNTAVLITAI